MQNVLGMIPCNVQYPDLRAKKITNKKNEEMNFAFELNQQVSILASNESGKVIGRAQYSTGENTYLIRYKAADGRAVEQWWGESALFTITRE
jgi:hypothetical protein